MKHPGTYKIITRSAGPGLRGGPLLSNPSYQDHLPLMKTILTYSDLLKRSAPSGTRTPNPLIKRQIHPESHLRSNCFVSASVCSSLPLSELVAVEFSCQTRYPITGPGAVLSSALLVEAADR